MYKEYLLACKKWRNIQYDFNDSPRNCSLNVFIMNEVIQSFYFNTIFHFKFFQLKFIQVTDSIVEIESCHFFNIFIPLISRATKCKINFTDFQFNKSVYKGDFLYNIIANNVRSYSYFNG